MAFIASRKLAALFAFAVASVLNPGYFAGCISDQEPDFGEEEMLAVLSAANAMGPYAFDTDDARYEAELTFVQRDGEDARSGRAMPLSTRAFACGSRTFLRSASACVDVTLVPVEATLTLRRVDQEPTVEIVSELAMDGRLRVFGLELDNAYIEIEYAAHRIDLRAGDGRNFELIAFYAADLGPMRVDIHFAADD